MNEWFRLRVNTRGIVGAIRWEVRWFYRRRVKYPFRNALLRRFGVPVESWGTDCDGMRWADVSWHWTLESADRYIEESSTWDDGPTRRYITTRKKAINNEAARNGWADGRDRYAEAAGY